MPIVDKDNVLILPFPTTGRYWEDAGVANSATVSDRVIVTRDEDHTSVWILVGGPSSWRQRRRPQAVNEAQDLSEQGSWDGDLR